MSNDQYQGLGGRENRIDTMTPQSLTPEESELLKRLRQESSWTRGYPLALITGGMTLMATKNMASLRGKIALTIIGMVTGNVVGKLSYLPVIQERILTDLPETSPLRQKLEAFKKGGPEAVAKLGLSQLKNYESGERTDHDISFATGSEYDSKNMEPATELAEQPRKKATTYEDLRKKHRGDDVPSTPKKYETLGFLNQNQPVDEKPSYPSSDSFQSTKADTNSGAEPVRYNKYGDPIMD